MIKTILNVSCDLCDTSKSFENKIKLLSEYLEISFESNYEDRSFYDKYICRNCYRKIVEKGIQEKW